MLCEKCGHPIYENESYCRACGYKCRTEIPVMRSEEKMGAQHGLANPAKMIILSILLLLSVFFLPMYNRGLIMGEIYPNDQSVYFNEVMEIVSEDDNPFEYYVVLFTAVALGFGVLLMLSAFVRSKMMCIVSSVGGIVGMLYYLCTFIAQEGSENVFSINETAICIGFWVTLLLFVISFFEAIKSKSNA